MYQGRVDPLKVVRGHVTHIYIMYRHVNVEIRTWRRFSNVGNGRIWKKGLWSAMNLLYRVWMLLTCTTRCTCKLSVHKCCIAINSVTNFRYRQTWLNFDIYICCMPSPHLLRVDTLQLRYHIWLLSVNKYMLEIFSLGMALCDVAQKPVHNAF